MGDNWARDFVMAKYRPTTKSPSAYLLYHSHIKLHHGTNFAPDKKAASIFWNVRSFPYGSNCASDIYPGNHQQITNVVS